MRAPYACAGAQRDSGRGVRPGRQLPRLPPRRLLVQGRGRIHRNRRRRRGRGRLRRLLRQRDHHRPVRITGGAAAQLFNHGNGLACDREGGSLEIAGLKDGGWYWITDETNSAVGNLVSRDILDNDTVELTSAGDGVTMMAGSGAVFVKEAATGRVGILPNILPKPRMDPPRKCGYNDRGTAGTSATATADQDNAQFTRRASECALGDGGAVALATTTTNSFTGATTTVADKASVVRPNGTGSVVVTVDLWGNGSGHFTTAATGHALLGQSAAATTTLRDVARLTGATYSARLGAGPTAADLVSARRPAASRWTRPPRRTSSRSALRRMTTTAATTTTTPPPCPSPPR